MKQHIMGDKVLWEYLGNLPWQEAAWIEWERHLGQWRGFKAFSRHYLRLEETRAELLECRECCGNSCPRRVIEDSPYDIKAVCPQDKALPEELSFRDILNYSLLKKNLHLSLCVSLKIGRPSGNLWPEFGSTWYLGDYFDDADKAYHPVYLTYRTATLNEAVRSLCNLHNQPFVLLTPTTSGLGPDAQQLIAMNNSVLLSMEAELSLLQDGSFKPVRGISEYTKFTK